MVSYKLAQLISIVVFTCACMNIEAGLISRNASCGLTGRQIHYPRSYQTSTRSPSGGGGKQLIEADKASLIEKAKAKAAAGGTPGPSPAAEGAPTPTKRQTTPGSAGGGAKLPQLSEAEKASLIEKVKAKAAAGGSGAPGPSPAGAPLSRQKQAKRQRSPGEQEKSQGSKTPLSHLPETPRFQEISEATKANILDRSYAKAQAAGTTVHPDITKHLSPTPPAKTRKQAETGTPSGNQPPGVPAGDTKVFQS
ncbi:hypothetical protein Pst134EA_031993 [Puccinia striiformis f. sp. tritici]|uniref:uncharacterized protein n=1 Tax=Puccinia striiformis f. sp. tritici TaxID=168172 RepID=UPI00200856EA|nr:uncharacterized protein Pst134EA_031993 [Puccinia striiformis f. sp. tritici]KAH9441949.1 hypothetical protein Pst134EA_031993 [Puccinia striiformis f. sp. tritici]